MVSPENPWLSMAEAAHYTNLSIFTLRRAIARGDLAAVKLTNTQQGRVRFRRDELDRWLESRPKARPTSA